MDWYEVQNRLFNSTLTRCGFKNNILIVTLPLISELDKKALRKGTCLVAMKGFNEDVGCSYGVFYRLKLNDLVGKCYLKYMQTCEMHKPTDYNIIPYERRKREWNEIKDTENLKRLEEIDSPEYKKRGFHIKEYVVLLENDLITEEYFKVRGLTLNYTEQDLLAMIELVKKRKLDKAKEEDKVIIDENIIIEAMKTEKTEEILDFSYLNL